MKDIIVQLFPNYENRIDFLLQSNENFRDLCADYMLCNSMVVIRKNNITTNIDEFAEFVKMQKEMEIEILNEIIKG